MSDLNICIIQSHIFWHQSNKNKDHFNELFLKIKKDKNPDLVVLPEMFNTGFTTDINEALPYHEIEAWLIEQSNKNNFAIIGSSLVLNKNQERVNRCFLANKDNIQFYDKAHLFVLSSEFQDLKPGKIRPIFSLNDWKIMPTICFDLRFPEWNSNQNEYDLLINVASWPKVRSDHWITLLKARAIENQAYVVGCNRVGVDGNNIDYQGDSIVYNYEGDVLAELPKDESGMMNVTINKCNMLKYRKKFNLQKSKAHYSINFEEQPK